MGDIFPGKPIEKVSRAQEVSMDSFIFTHCVLQLNTEDFKKAVRVIQAKEPDITHWTFGE